MIFGITHEIIACDLNTGEVYPCNTLKAITDIASQFQIENEQAIHMLKEQFLCELPEIMCPNKNASFWVEAL